jgi:hypothetical protein
MGNKLMADRLVLYLAETLRERCAAASANLASSLAR